MLDPQGALTIADQVGIAAPVALELFRALKIKEEDLEVTLTAVTAFWTEADFSIPHWFPFGVQYFQEFHSVLL